jgi:predicted aspartyl protease
VNRHQICARLSVLIVLSLCGSITFGSSRQERKIAELPFEISNNLIILQGSINGSKPLSFLLDTGAEASVISEERAQELGLKLEEQTDATTQGGSIEASLIKNGSLRLAGVEIPKLILAAISLGGLESGLGRRVDGILGFDVYNRFVVEIDYSTKIIRFYEPQSYYYSGRGEIIPVTIEENTPFIRASISLTKAQTFEGLFLVDLGAAGALTLNSPFVKKYKLLETVPQTVGITAGGVLAGKASARVGRLSSLHIGRFTIANPVTNFSQDTEGDDASSDNDGRIGGEILRRFKIVVDYSRKQVILEPNEHLSEPYEFDMSGASLAAGGADFKTFKVRALVEKSPASEAGLRVGDVITALDGKPATGMTLEQIRQMFRQAGRKYLLSVNRNGSQLQMSLTTRRLI